MNGKQLQERLSQVDLFDGLGKKELKEIASGGRTTTHADGREVIVEGTGAVGFHLILSGQAEVKTGAAVRRTLGAGDYFGEISAIDGRPRSASVLAVGELETFMVTPSVLQRLISSSPELGRHLLVLLCARLREAEKVTSQD